MSESVVLDASALLAFLNKEPGCDQIAHLLSKHVVMSAVNVSEVVGKLTDFRMSVEQVRTVIALLGVDICHFDRESAYMTAALRSSTKSYGFSFGDRSCLALAQQLRLPAYTADRKWLELDLDLQVISIR